MRIAPPLTVTNAEINLSIQLLDAAIARVMNGAGHAPFPGTNPVRQAAAGTS